jgi:hypothetical protein
MTKKLLIALMLTACGGDDFADSPVPEAGGSGGTGASDDAGMGGTGGTGGSAGASGTGGVSGHDAGDGDAGTAGTGGEDGGDGGDAEAEPSCDPMSTPGEDACVIHDVYGIFVSPNGSDGAACGTMASPCATIGAGLLRAKADDKRLYACGDDGDYVEAVTVDASVDGLALYGGFRCSDWTYAPSTVRAHVIPSHEGVAWTVDGLTAGLEVNDFAIESNNVTMPGASSIAAIAVGSTNVVFRNTTFTAGDGAKGSDGNDGDDGTNAPEPGAGQKGIAATCTTPPGTHTGGSWELAQIICGSEGGKGGYVERGSATEGKAGGPGSQGTPIANVVPPVMGGGGTGSTNVLVAGGVGSPGSPGNSGGNGAAAPAIGVFSSIGFDPAHGANGTDGFPGQGGGGGGAGASKPSCTGASGGAGGIGGCGGKPGTGGWGGGGSIALLSWSSSVTLDACTLTTGRGGDGGRGGNGGGGGAPSLGSDGGPSGDGMVRAGMGGPGGAGGRGGSGSGGTGGPSYPVVYHGSVPSEVSSTSTPGNGGSRGIGGTAVGGDKAPDGTDGASGVRFEVL